MARKNLMQINVMTSKILDILSAFEELYPEIWCYTVIIIITDMNQTDLHG